MVNLNCRQLKGYAVMSTDYNLNWPLYLATINDPLLTSQIVAPCRNVHDQSLKWNKFNANLDKSN